MHTFKNNSTSFTASNNYLNPVFTTDYNEDISYDPNGNILKYRRYGNSASQGTTNQYVMDSLTYNYFPGTNQLKYIKDTVSAASFTVDIDNQTLNNYGYDAIGNMVKDSLAGIDSIKWTVYGKIQTIYKHNATVINYSYDASGNRISKVITGGTSGNGETWYVHDASGNVMSIYTVNDNTVNSGALTLTEQEIYGSSRVGMIKPGLNLSSYTAPTKINMSSLGSVGYYTTFTRGKKFFELDNHLGNVLVTVSDKKFGVSTNNNGTVNYYTADIVSAEDYYPGGMIEPGRSYTATSSSKYRYSFNAKEDDAEAENGFQNYGMREYDRLSDRFISVDPITSKYAYLTPYQFASNSPIVGMDLDGLEILDINKYPLGSVWGLTVFKVAGNYTLNDLEIKSSYIHNIVMKLNLPKEDDTPEPVKEPSMETEGPEKDNFNDQLDRGEALANGISEIMTIIKGAAIRLYKSKYSGEFDYAKASISALNTADNLVRDVQSNPTFPQQIKSASVFVKADLVNYVTDHRLPDTKHSFSKYNQIIQAWGDLIVNHQNDIKTYNFSPKKLTLKETALHATSGLKIVLHMNYQVSGNSNLDVIKANNLIKGGSIPERKTQIESNSGGNQ